MKPIGVQRKLSIAALHQHRGAALVFCAADAALNGPAESLDCLARDAIVDNVDDAADCGAAIE